MPTRINKPTVLSAGQETWIDRATLGLLRPRQMRLDPRTLTDHLKRDMGFLDGRGPTVKRC
ncbi:MAG TPA: hypothetical protein VNS34_27615 [Rhizobiaceae bacterium]|nr:hypothetical protein [Rhizobiaceae bacterium]